MGSIALIVFLCSLAVFLVCVGILGWSAREIYRSVRYAQKDSEAWIALFGEYTRGLQENMKIMHARGEEINRMGLEMRESIDEMRDAVDELRSSRLVRLASFISRRRNN